MYRRAQPVRHAWSQLRQAFLGLQGHLSRQLLAVASLGLVGLHLLASGALAQISDPLAPSIHRPQIGASANGTPQVDIATPSAGVSHNKYQSFNVTTRGLILNNATAGGMSQIGGLVAGNPNLTSSGSASLILNEVTGRGGSSLTGTTEVFGKSADVIVANPDGVTCSSCSFLNASNTTLTTGKPLVLGSSVILNVSGGAVSVAGSGLSTPDGSATLVGRGLIINAPVTAGQSLRLSGGAQQFDARTGQASLAAIPANSGQQYSIQSSAGGLLTAGQGDLIVQSLEPGQSVSLSGKLSAAQGQVQVTSGAALSVTDVLAAYNISLSALGDLSQSGAVVSQQGDVALAGQTVFQGSGSSTLGQNIAITAQGSYVNLGAQEALASLDLDAGGTVTNFGSLVAGGKLSVRAGGDLLNEKAARSLSDIEAYKASYQSEDWVLRTRATPYYYRSCYRRGWRWRCSWRRAYRYTRYWAPVLRTHYADAERLISQGEARVSGGAMGGQDLVLQADEGSIYNTAGSLVATRDLSANAKYDIVNASRWGFKKNKACGFSDCGSTAQLYKAEMLAGDDLALVAGGSYRSQGADLAAYNSIDMQLGGDLQLEGTRHTSTDVGESRSDTAVTYSHAWSNTRCWGRWWWRRCSTSYYSTPVAGNQTRITYTKTSGDIYQGSAIETLAGDLAINVGGDALISGSNLSAGNDLSLIAVGSVDFQRPVATQRSQASYSQVSGGYVYGGRWYGRNATTPTSTANLQNRYLASASGANVSIQGAQIDGEGLRLIASGDLSLRATEGSIGLLADRAAAEANSYADLASVEVSDLPSLGASRAAYDRLLAGNTRLASVAVLRSMSDGSQLAALFNDIGLADEAASSYQRWDAASRSTVATDYWRADARLGALSAAELLAKRRAVILAQPGSELAGIDATNALSAEWIAWQAYDRERLAARYALTGAWDEAIVSARGDMNLEAKDAIVLFGGTMVNAGSDLSLRAGGDIALLAEESVGYDWRDADARFAAAQDYLAGYTHNSQGQRNNLGQVRRTAVTAGNGITMIAGRHILNKAGSIAAGGNLVAVAQEGSIYNDAARLRFVLTGAQGCQGSACGGLGVSYAAAEMLAGGDLILSAKASVFNRGSDLGAAGNLLATAETGDIRNESLHDVYRSTEVYKKWSTCNGRFWGICYKWTRHTLLDVRDTAVSRLANMTTEFGDIELRAGRDILSSAALMSAGGQIGLAAVRDVALDSQGVEWTYSQKRKSTTSFLFIPYKGGKLDVAGNQFDTHLTRLEANAIDIQAGNNLRGLGANLLAFEDITLSAGNNLVFDALQNHKYKRERGSSWGLFWTVGGIDLINDLDGLNGKQLFQAFIDQNPMLASLQRLSSCRNALDCGLDLASSSVQAVKTLSGAAAASLGPDKTLTSGLVEQFNPFSSSELAKLKACNPMEKECNFLGGLGFRYSAWTQSQNWTESHTSQILSSGDLAMAAGNDLTLAGGTVASVGKQLYASAGRNLAVTALADTQSSKRSDWGASLTFNGSGSFTLGANGSQARSSAMLFQNAALTAGEGAYFQSGQDMRFAGANVKAGRLTIDAGRDLLILSRQNQSASNSYGFNFSITATPGTGITGIGIGGSYGKSNRKYTDTPTSLLADEDVNVTVGRTTYLLGAVLASKTNKLKLDTANFIFDNYSDKDVSGSVGVNVNIGLDPKGINPASWDGTGSLAYRDQRAITYATLGLGDITIRNRPNQDLSGLNRDLGNVQRVTRDIDFDVHIPGLNLKTLAEDLEAAGNFLRAATAEIPAHIKADAVAVDLYRDLMVRGLDAGQIRQFMASPAFGVLLERRKVMTYTAELHGWDAIDKQKLQTLAILEGFEVQKIDGQSQLVMPCNNTAGQTKCQIDLEKLQAILADVDGKQLVEDVLNGSVKTMFSRLSFQLASADEWYLANDSLHINHLFDSLMMCMFLEPQVFNDFVHANPVIFDKAAPWFGGAEKLDGFLADAEASGWSRKGTARAFKENVGGVNRIIAGLAIDVVGLIYGTGDLVGDVPAITGALASSGWAFATDPEVRATVGETLGALYQHMSEDPQGFAEELRQAGLDAWSASQLAHALEQRDYMTAAGFVGPELVGTVLGGVKALQLASKLRKAKDGTTALAKTAQEVLSIGGETCVYSCVINGATRYVGITNDIARRGSEHLREKGIRIVAIRGLASLSRPDARAVEQTLIHYYGLGKNGGTLLNKINSISPINNPTAYEEALVRGKELLDSVGYEWLE